jgi:hypothetical protein
MLDATIRTIKPRLVATAINGQRRILIRSKRCNVDGVTRTKPGSTRWFRIGAGRNPAKVRMQKYRRRMREAVGKGFVQADLDRLLLEQKNLCLGCRMDIETCFTVDHKTPLSRGGTNEPVNLQLLCLPCNSSKGTRTNEEWLATKENPVPVG